MKIVLDLHTHSYFSDGTGMPADLVATARNTFPELAHLALSDHRTFAGSPYFIAACEGTGIEGFVSSEISGSHPRHRGIEFHFLTVFGNAWTPGVAARTREFSSYFNHLAEVDIGNIFRFLNALATLGEIIDFRDVLEETYRRTYLHADPADPPAAMARVLFKDLRAAITARGLVQKFECATLAEFETRIKEKAGIHMEPTPVINEAFDIIQRTEPAVIQAHPHLCGLSIDEMRPLWEEWKREMGLLAIEAHYKDQFLEEWAAAARNAGLLISAGSDTHTLWNHGDGTVQPPAADGEAAENYTALLDRLRAAGNAPQTTTRS